MKTKLSLNRLGIAACCVALAALAHFNWPRPPTGPPPAVWTQRPVQLVGLGDSVTWGYGAGKGSSYFALLSQVDLPPRLPNLTCLNLARNGATSFDLLSDELPRLPQAGPYTVGLVVVTIGGNDLIHPHGRHPPSPEGMYGASLRQAQPWIPQFGERLQEMVVGVRMAFPAGYHILLANIFDPTDGVGDIESAPIPLPAWKDGMAVLTAYNQELESTLATIHQDPGHSIQLVDLHRLFLGHGIHYRDAGLKVYHPEDPSYWYFFNLEDPNSTGYGAIRAEFFKAMERLRF